MTALLTLGHFRHPSDVLYCFLVGLSSWYRFSHLLTCCRLYCRSIQPYPSICLGSSRVRWNPHHSLPCRSEPAPTPHQLIEVEPWGWRKPLHLKVRYIAPFGAFTIPHLELKVKVSKAYNKGFNAKVLEKERQMRTKNNC
jgi:hypothetical protein